MAAAPKIHHKPLGGYDQFAGEADQIEDVHKTPRKPGKKAGKAPFAYRGDSFRCADGRHDPFVYIMERGAFT